MDLLALADFNLVARHGGFGLAARASGRPKITLSRRVAELEASLGVRLFERGAGRPRLTEQGRVLHERTAQLPAEIDEVASAIASGEGRPRGRLRISILGVGLVGSHVECRLGMRASMQVAGSPSALSAWKNRIGDGPVSNTHPLGHEMRACGSTPLAAAGPRHTCRARRVCRRAE